MRIQPWRQTLTSRWGTSAALSGTVLAGLVSSGTPPTLPATGEPRPPPATSVRPARGASCASAAPASRHVGCLSSLARSRPAPQTSRPRGHRGAKPSGATRGPCHPPPRTPATCSGAGRGGLGTRCPCPPSGCPAAAPLALRAQGAPRVAAQQRVPPQAGEASQQPPGVQTAIGQHEDGPRRGHRPAHLAQHTPPLPAPGLLGGGQQHGPGERDGTATLHHADGQDRTVRAPEGGIQGQGEWGALPHAQHPGQPRSQAGLDD
jgi:hypothetical protein